MPSVVPYDAGILIQAAIPYPGAFGIAAARLNLPLLHGSRWFYASGTEYEYF